MAKVIKYILFLIIIISTIEDAYSFKIERVCMDAANNVTIYWTNDFNYCDSFIKYIVYGQETSTTVFKKVDSVNSYYLTTYIHNNAGSTSNQWRYFVQVIYKCSGDYIYLFSDSISVDKKPPENIQIDSVTVNGNFVNIGWKKSSSKDVMGYAIFYVDDNNTNVLINKVFGKESTSYVDSVIGLPNNRKERYRIVAFDSCDNYSDISFQHNTMFLVVQQNFCEKVVLLSWNHYDAWIETNREYQVIVSYGTKGFRLYGKVKGNLTSFRLDTLSDGINYCIKIVAKNILSNYTSSSNLYCLVTNFVDSKSSVYINTITIEDQSVVVKWLIKDASDIEKITLYKGENGSNLLFFKQYIYAGIDEFEEKDDFVDVSKNIYKYQVEIKNKCNQIVALSNESRNILLILDEKDIGGTLKWNKYSTWDAGVENYIVNSFDTEEKIWKFEAKLQNHVIYFQSGLEKDKMAGYEKCFYIEANEGYGNSYGLKEKSNSNVICITGKPIVYFMNAIVPGSNILENRRFIPIGKLIDFERSKMVIFNRWGDMVWEENGITDGWDGKISNNDFAPSGVYIYKVLVVGKDNKEYNFNGTFTLLR